MGTTDCIGIPYFRRYPGLITTVESSLSEATGLLIPFYAWVVHGLIGASAESTVDGK